MEQEINYKKIKESKNPKEFQKNVEEMLNVKMTDEESKQNFEHFLGKSGELSDKELGSVSGGACYKHSGSKMYGKQAPHFLIVSHLNSKCKLYQAHLMMGGICCTSCEHTFTVVENRGGVPVRDHYRCGGFLYCQARTYYNDPVRDAKK